MVVPYCAQNAGSHVAFINVLGKSLCEGLCKGLCEGICKSEGEGEGAWEDWMCQAWKFCTVLLSLQTGRQTGQSSFGRRSYDKVYSRR